MSAVKIAVEAETRLAGSRWVPAMLRADQSNGHDSLKACEAA
ncbi:hypothetical protein [Pseudomonas monteilii]|nr:hypothetical protein [Pseudomonas monteilii]